MSEPRTEAGKRLLEYADDHYEDGHGEPIHSEHLVSLILAIEAEAALPLDRHQLAARIMASLDEHGGSYHLAKRPSDLAYAVADDLLAALPPATPSLPAGTKLVLMADELMDALASEERNVTWTWGEPDEHGWYTPTFTRHAPSEPEPPALDGLRALRAKVAAMPYVAAQARCWDDHETSPHGQPHADGSCCPDADGPAWEAVKRADVLALIDAATPPTPASAEEAG